MNNNDFRGLNTTSSTWRYHFADQLAYRVEDLLRKGIMTESDFLKLFAMLMVSFPGDKETVRRKVQDAIDWAIRVAARENER